MCTNTQMCSSSYSSCSSEHIVGGTQEEIITHRGPVCFTKYMGKPETKSAGAAASSQDGAPTSSSSVDKGKQTTATTSNVLATDIKAQADLLAKLGTSKSTEQAAQGAQILFLDWGLAPAATRSLHVMMDCTDFFVLNCLVPTVLACEIDSSSDVLATDCLSLTPPSTSACEMNISSSGIHAPHVTVQQVMNSDAALNSVIVPETKSTRSHFHILYYWKGCHCTTKVAAMVDSGATFLFIDHKNANSHKMLKEPLKYPITLYNIDGSQNEAGSITHKVTLLLKVGQDKEKFDFYITSLGPEKVILGLPWLSHCKSEIDWQKGTMKLSADQGMNPEPLELEVTKIEANRMEHQRLLAEKVLDTSQDEVYCLAGFTYSQQIAEKAIAAKGKKTFEEMVPLQYSIWTSLKYSPGKNPNAFQKINHETILLT